MALPVLLRFINLASFGITNWPSLKRRIEQDNFPPGRYVGRKRVWTLEEVQAWFDARPEGGRPPDIVLKPGPSGATEGTGRDQSQATPNPLIRYCASTPS